MVNATKFENITQLKSWLNLEPTSGCPYSCAYCFRNSDGDFALKEPIPLVSIEGLISDLLKHPLFVPDKTHLSISGTKGDAFLPQNKESTFQILKLLDDTGLKNLVTIVTKGLITKSDATRLKLFKKITPIVFVTYSEMPKTVESVPNEQRINSLENLHSEGIKTILYWRPIIDGYNNNESAIKKVLSIGEEFVDAFVISGLRMTKEIKNNFELLGLKLPDINWDPNHKYISEETKSIIISQYRALKCQKPLFYKSFKWIIKIHS